METPSPFPGDMSEQIVSHKLSILKREYPKRYETLESTVKTLQCNVRVRRAKKAFALRKAVSAHLPRPCLQTTPDEVMPFQLNIICRALLHGALAGWAVEFTSWVALNLPQRVLRLMGARLGGSERSGVQ
jgi:hypothetical protein